jgi:hypothetical protein
MPHDATSSVSAPALTWLRTRLEPLPTSLPPRTGQGSSTSLIDLMYRVRAHIRNFIRLLETLPSTPSYLSPQIVGEQKKILNALYRALGRLEAYANPSTPHKSSYDCYSP